MLIGSQGQSDPATGRIVNLIKSRRSKRHWLPAYLKLINTHPTLGEGQNGKLYGCGPDPFPPPRNKKGKCRLRETNADVHSRQSYQKPASEEEGEV